jgi:antitoxin (DNA-binding transcriptional repressor) of toxin-antitoxin stability system
LPPRRAGQEVVLTERGKPIAVIRPLPALDPARAAVERMIAEGRLRSPEKAGPLPRRRWKPIRLQGRPLADSLLEDRSAR